MEPGGACQYGVPVDRIRLHLADGRAGPVVDHHRGALARAGLREVDPDTAAAAQDPAGLHAFGAQRADRRLADRVRRQTRDVLALEPELREADGDVRLAAAECRAEHGGLQEALEPRRAQTQHDLAEGDDRGS